MYIYKNKLTDQYYNFRTDDVDNIDNASQYELEPKNLGMDDPFYKRVEYAKEVRKLKILKLNSEEYGSNVV